MSASPTGTSGRPRTGIGTVRRFRHVNGTTYVRLERQNGQDVVLSLSPDLSQKLLDRYGHKETATFISVSPLIGLQARYVETATGMLTDLEVLDN